MDCLKADQSFGLGWAQGPRPRPSEQYPLTSYQKTLKPPVVQHRPPQYRERKSNVYDGSIKNRLPPTHANIEREPTPTASGK